MAETTNHIFGYQELAEILVKKQDIHEGLWGIYIEFGLGAANVPISPDGKTLAPAAINMVQKIGIQRFAETSNLTVDAAEVNPAPRKTASKRRTQ